MQQYFANMKCVIEAENKHYIWVSDRTNMFRQRTKWKLDLLVQMIRACGIGCQQCEKLHEYGYMDLTLGLSPMVMIRKNLQSVKKSRNNTVHSRIYNIKYCIIKAVWCSTILVKPRKVQIQCRGHNSPNQPALC